MYSLKIEIENQLPKSLNKELRTNFRARNRKNKKWDFLIALACKSKLPPKPLQKASIRIVRHFWRTLDYDGLVGSMKPVVDALVSCGVLIDDRWSVTGKWEVDQVFLPKAKGSLLQIEIIENDSH